jgi:hypothetical protein
MKISIYGGEAFPVYEVHGIYGVYPEIEVSEEVLDRWEGVFKSFEAMQEEIIKELEKQEHGDKIWAGRCAYNGYKVNED